MSPSNVSPAQLADLAAEHAGHALAPKSATDATAGCSIAQAAEATGINAHTLRYYERIGLMEVPRDRAGHRVYGDFEIGRIVFLSVLRAADMPIRDLQRYFALGAEAIEDRAQILAEHRARIEQSIADLNAALGLIDYKIARLVSSSNDA